MRQTQTLVFEARPAPAEVVPSQAAVIVVDMQNDFGSKGGMFDRAGIDISGIQAAVAPTARALAAARRAGIHVVYLRMGYKPDLSDLGGPGAPNRLVHVHGMSVGKTVATPDGREGRILVRDTWGTDIIDALAPDADDTVLYKTRFSGFYETDLHEILQARGITQLVVTGCTTSICVESTVRDAFFRDYHCVVLADCTAEPIGAGMTRSNHEASLMLVEIMFGRVSTSHAFCAAVESSGRRLAS